MSNTLGIGIKVDPGDAAAKAKGVQDALAGAEDQGKRTQKAFDSLGETFKKIGGAQLNQQLEGTAKGFGSVAAAIQRERSMLEQMHKPMQDYQRDLQTLTSLRQRDLISATEHAKQMAELQRKAGIESPMDSLKNLAVPAAAIGGLALSVIHLSDAYTELENKAKKFTDATHTANQVISEQLDLAGDLHASLEDTMSVYDSVRDGTDDLNLSHEKQIELTRTLGEATELSGRSLSEVGGIMDRFSAAMAGGVDGTATLRKMMVQMPDLAELWTKSFNTTRAGFLQMVADHKIGMSQVIDVTIKGSAVHEEFAKRTETVGQRWQHLKDEFIASLGVVKRLGDEVVEYEDALKNGGFAMLAFSKGMDEGRDHAEKFFDVFANAKGKIEDVNRQLQVWQMLTNANKALGAYARGSNAGIQGTAAMIGGDATSSAAGFGDAADRLAQKQGGQNPLGAFQNTYDAATAATDELFARWTQKAKDAEAEAFDKAMFANLPTVPETKFGLGDQASALGLSMGLGGPNGDLAKAADGFDEMTTAMERNQRAQDELLGHMKPVEDFFVQLEVTGKASFKSLTDSIIADVARMGTHDLLKYLLGLASPSPAGGLGALTSFVGDGGSHAFGGSYVAPSTGGGQDSISAMFRISPGERVDFTPPGMAPRGGGNDGGSAPPVQVHVVDQRSERSLSRSGQDVVQVVLDDVARNPGKWRALIPSR